ncbi:MAG: hypothetical protein COT74_02065 [Bdellovibrionales bacterium CG10_big_fil_rev_8_21_14_0_10_45_34]|nr:MAG: hypothetical protein COT74_02065 [Bdellovibrionales bacterium CG10_big_fil_rev_8_21_14_0_10_45_34]
MSFALRVVSVGLTASVLSSAGFSQEVLPWNWVGRAPISSAGSIFECREDVLEKATNGSDQIVDSRIFEISKNQPVIAYTPISRTQLEYSIVKNDSNNFPPGYQGIPRYYGEDFDILRVVRKSQNSQSEQLAEGAPVNSIEISANLENSLSHMSYRIVDRSVTDKSRSQVLEIRCNFVGNSLGTIRYKDTFEAPASVRDIESALQAGRKLCYGGHYLAALDNFNLSQSIRSVEFIEMVTEFDIANGSNGQQVLAAIEPYKIIFVGVKSQSSEGGTRFVSVTPCGVTKTIIEVR